MIEQQYYTRERGGLFSKTDGYDTIAKSPMLKLDFIKKYIHPICHYDSPSELQKSGEEDETKYPPHFIIMPVPSGELIVGQAVYKNKDFTGLRSTFFMHNYILSANEKHRYVKEPDKLFGITGFESSYDMALGQELLTLAAIPYEGNNPLFMVRERLFNELKIDEKLFEKLLAAVFTAVNSKKKVFIVLDVPISELGMYAKALLYHIYLSLPWSVTEELGVSTYSRSSEAKKNIHITFLEKGTLRYDTKISKEYILDFENTKFLNLDETTHLDAYFKVANMFRGVKPLWEKFNNYAEQLLTAMKDKGEKSLSFYNRVATAFALYAYSCSHKTYLLEEGREREGFLTGLLEYFSLPLGEDFKRELMQLTGYAIDSLEASLRGGRLLSKDEIIAIIHFKLKIHKDNEAGLEETLRILLEAIELARRDKEDTYIRSLLIEASKESSLYQSLFAKLYSRDELKEEVGYVYLKESLEGINHLEALISKVAHFEPVETILFTDIYYSNLVKNRFMDCAQVAHNKVKFLEKVEKWCENREGRLYRELLILGEEHFLKHVRLEAIESEEALCHISFKHSYEDEKYEMIKDYQKLKTNIEAMSPKYIKVNPAVQRQIQHFYSQTVRREDFYMLVYAFLESKKGTSNEWQLNLPRVLAYLYPISPEIMLDFVIWSKGQEFYMNKGSFDATIIQFFTRLKEREGKWPKELVKQKLDNQLKTKMLYSKLNKAMQPAFLKFVSRYGKNIGIGCLVTVICAGLGIGGYFIYKNYLITPSSAQGTEQTPTAEIDAPLQASKDLQELPKLEVDLTIKGINTVILRLEEEIKFSMNTLGLPEDAVKKELELIHNKEAVKNKVEAEKVKADEEVEADKKMAPQESTSQNQ